MLQVVVHLSQWTLGLCLCSGGQLAPRLSGSAGPGDEFLQPEPEPEPELSGKQSLGRWWYFSLYVSVMQLSTEK